MFDSVEEIKSIFLKSILTQLKIIESIKLPDIKNNKKVHFRDFEAWRSEQSLNVIKQNIISLEQYYMYAFDDALSLAHADDAVLVKSQFTMVLSIIASISQPLRDAINDEADKKRLINLKLKVAQLISILERTLIGRLNIQGSFNSLDGD